MTPALFRSPESVCTPALEMLAAAQTMQEWVDETLPRQQRDGGKQDGGFPEGSSGWCDGRNSAFVVASLVAARTWKDRLSLDLPTLDDSIVRGVRFIIRRQSPDGRMDLGGMHTPNEAGFTLPPLADAYAALEATGEFEESCDQLRTYLRRGAEAVLKGSAYTANHRWAAACAPLSAVHRLWPDQRYLDKIRSYLADGIDCDSDGCWYIERSPNYNTVANEGLIVMADNLGDPSLLEHVVRNMEFTLHTLQPNGEADSSYSHRQDRALRNCPPGSYVAARRAALLTGDGRFTTLARLIWEFPQARRSNHIPLPFELDRQPGPLPAPEPLPVRYERYFPTPQVLRRRDNDTALTLGVDSEKHFFNSVLSQWGGARSSDDWFHLHHGDVVIQSIHLAGAGMANIQPSDLAQNAPGDYTLSGSAPGWTHPLHFRSPHASVYMPWDWRHQIHVRWQGDTLTLDLDSEAPHSLAAVLRLWVRAPFQVIEGNTAQQLNPGEEHWLRGGSTARLECGVNSLRIEGLPASEHHFPAGPFQSIPSAMKTHCACLSLGLTFPVALRLTLKLR